MAKLDGGLRRTIAETNNYGGECASWLCYMIAGAANPQALSPQPSPSCSPRPWLSMLCEAQCIPKMAPGDRKRRWNSNGVVTTKKRKDGSTSVHLDLQISNALCMARLGNYRCIFIAKDRRTESPWHPILPTWILPASCANPSHVLQGFLDSWIR